MQWLSQVEGRANASFFTNEFHPFQPFGRSVIIMRKLSGLVTRRRHFMSQMFQEKTTECAIEMPRLSIRNGTATFGSVTNNRRPNRGATSLVFHQKNYESPSTYELWSKKPPP